MSNFNSREFNKDTNKYLNWIKFPEGITDDGDEIDTMTAQEYVEKHSDNLPDDVDADRLPKTRAGLMTYLVSYAVGAKKSIKRDKLTTVDIDEVLENPDYEDLLDPNAYSSIEKDDDDNEVRVYFERPEHLKKYTRNIIRAVQAVMSKELTNNNEYLEEDLMQKTRGMINKASLTLFEDLNQTVEGLESKIVTNVNKNSELETLKKVHKVYADQIVTINNGNNSLALGLKALPTNEARKEFFDAWQNSVTTKFLEMRKITPDRGLDNSLAKTYMDLSLQEVAPAHGLVLNFQMPADINLGNNQQQQQQGQQQQPNPKPEANSAYLDHIHQNQSIQQQQQQQIAPPTNQSQVISNPPVENQPGAIPQQQTPGMPPKSIATQQQPNVGSKTENIKAKLLKATESY